MPPKSKNDRGKATGPRTRPSKPPNKSPIEAMLRDPVAQRLPSNRAPAVCFGGRALARATGQPPPRKASNPGARKHPTPEKQHSHYLECNQIALPFAVRRTDSVREVDAALVSAISEPSNMLQTQFIHPAKHSWDSVREQLSRGHIRPRRGASTGPPVREYQLVVKHSKWFVTFGRYKDMPGRVSEWFAKAVADPDIVAARAEVDLNSIAAVASHAGRLTETSLIFKKEHKEKKLVDVGVIRYPDPKQPYVKAYRIELTAWYESTIIFGYTFDTNGVKARINVEEFEPSGPATPSRRATNNRLAVAQTDALFA